MNMKMILVVLLLIASFTSQAQTKMVEKIIFT